MKKCSNCQKYLLPFFRYTTKHIEDAGKFFCKSCIIKHLGVVEERGGRARCTICHQDLSGIVYRIPKDKGYYCKKHAINIASENKPKPVLKSNISLTNFNQQHPNYDADVKKTEEKWEQRGEKPHSQLRKNQRTCQRCGNTYYIDINWGDYGFCTNPNCSNNN